MNNKIKEGEQVEISICQARNACNAVLAEGQSTCPGILGGKMEICPKNAEVGCRNRIQQMVECGSSCIHRDAGKCSGFKRDCVINALIGNPNN